MMSTGCARVALPLNNPSYFNERISLKNQKNQMLEEINAHPSPSENYSESFAQFPCLIHRYY